LTWKSTQKFTKENYTIIFAVKFNNNLVAKLSWKIYFICKKSYKSAKTDHQIGSRRKTALGPSPKSVSLHVIHRPREDTELHFPAWRPVKEGLASIMKYKTDHQIGSRRKTTGGPIPESVSLHVTQRPQQDTGRHFQERRLGKRLKSERGPKKLTRPITRSDQDERRLEVPSLSRCHSTRHSDRSRTLNAIFKKEDSGRVSRVKEDLEDLQDRSPDRNKTKDGRRTFPWVGVTPRDTATYEGTKSHFFKKEDSESV